MIIVTSVIVTLCPFLNLNLNYFVSGDRLPFPSLFESPSLDLSVIIPAYNEESRLPVMLDECVDYLTKNFSQKFEIVLVDDGSRDKTTSVGLVSFRSHSKVICNL